MDPIEKLLAELKDEYNCSSSKECSSPQEAEEGTNTHQKFQSNPIEPNPIKSNPKVPKSPDRKASSIPPSFEKADAIDRLLADVKTDFEQQDLEQELQRQEELEQQRLEQERLQAKQQELLQLRAQEWLSKLDPLSYEGLWFEKFARGYSSQLTAAIEYLQGNQEIT